MPDTPTKPDLPCPACGGEEFWLRTVWGRPARVCSRCHPNPNEEVTDETE